MAEDWELIGVNSEMIGETPCYRVKMKRPDGQEISHLMPQAAIDIRAAEYEIDHTSVEGKQQVIDILLHEMHGPAPQHLWEKTSISEARAAHLGGCEENKAQRVNVVWSGNPKKGRSSTKSTSDPAELLINHPANLEMVEAHRDRVHSIRQHLGLEKTPPRKQTQPPDHPRSMTVKLMEP